MAVSSSRKSNRRNTRSDRHRRYTRTIRLERLENRQMLAAVHDGGFAPMAEQQPAQGEQAQVAEALQEQLIGTENADAVVAIAREAGFDIAGAELARQQHEVESGSSEEELEQLAVGPAMVRELSHRHSGSDIDIEDMQPCSNDNQEGIDKTREAFVELMGWDEAVESVATALEYVAGWFGNLFSDDDDEDEEDDDSSSVDDNDSGGNDGNSGNGDGDNCPLCNW